MNMLVRLAEYYDKHDEHEKAVIQLTIAKNVINAFEIDFVEKYFKSTIYDSLTETKNKIEKMLGQ